MEPPCPSIQPENPIKVGLHLIHPDFCNWLYGKDVTTQPPYMKASKTAQIGLDLFENDKNIRNNSAGFDRIHLMHPKFEHIGAITGIIKGVLSSYEKTLTVKAKTFGSTALETIWAIGASGVAAHLSA